ncbi:transmembrane protein 40 [Eublepharis macularius]|uniref:Transmembrane protein 40 n=1 Tax=Eublepharis macularius TaxID=481883 RepID=A0AA97KYC2_EUBMA|nr:transmembrane protein 40 [Eublepharis macularius]
MNNSNSSVPVHPAEHEDGKRKQIGKSKSRGSEDESSAEELATQSQTQDTAKEVIPYSESEVMGRDSTTTDVSEKDTCHLPEHPRWWIRKDDEFFHFVIVCFAIGILLVCYYKYQEWTVSVGVGLMTFAALETTGIYFGLVYRIRAILDSFIPLLQRFKLPGFKKTN